MELIVIVSRTGAKIFEQNKEGALHIVDTVSNPDGRARNIDLVTDALVNDTHEEVVIRFAKKLGRHLHKMLVTNAELSFKIVADGKLVGLLKEEFGTREIAQIEWIQKNVEHIPQSEWPHLLKINTVKRYSNGMRLQRPRG